METISEKIKASKIQYKYAFFSTVIFSLIAQGMGLFNKFSVSDDINYSFNGGDPLPYGRWLLYLLRRAERNFFGDGLFSLPLINGTIAIICTGISLCLLVSLLDLRSKVLCCLLGGIAISVPCITGLFGHMYVAHFYSYALLLSVLGPYLILKKGHFLYTAAGIILLVCSAAVYQAYIPTALSVFLIGIIKVFYEAPQQQSKKALYKKTGLIIFSCIVFILSYLLITFIINKRFNIVLTGYKNIDSMGKLSISIYLDRIITAYKEFFLPSANTYYCIFPGNTRILNFMIIFFSLVFFGKMLWSVRKDRLLFGILTMLILLIPLAVNFIFVMIDQSSCSILMVYGKVMFFVIFAWILEKTAWNSRSSLCKFEKFFCTVVLSVLILMYCRFDNTCYLRMTFVQTQATRYYSGLINRIQSIEGYDSRKEIAWIGIPQPGTDESIDNIVEFRQIVMHPYFGLTNVLKGNWKEYMRVWCGFTAKEADPSIFINDPEVQSMPHYPDDGSIKMIRGTIVIKF